MVHYEVLHGLNRSSINNSVVNSRNGFAQHILNIYAGGIPISKASTIALFMRTTYSSLGLPVSTLIWLIYTSISTFLGLCVRSAG